jgi:exodeoxyribonuclease V gamma subunit
VEQEAESLAARAREISGGGAPETLEFDLREAGLGLVGRLDGIWDGVRVQARFSRLEGTWEIEEWIRHLALCAARPEGGRALTHLVARPPGKKKNGIHVRFDFVDDAGAQLENLVAIYRRGQSSPLPFFPRTSRKYALTPRTREKGNPEEQAIKAAYSAWRSDDANAASGQASFWSRGEGEDVHFARVFAGQDPLSVSWRPDPGTPEDGFRSLARQVFDPLLAHREGGD